MPRSASHEGLEPVVRFVAHLVAKRFQPSHGALGAGQDGELALHAGQVQARHDAVVALLDQEAVRGVGQGADQLVLVRGQAEAFDIVRRARPAVGHEDLGRGLLDDRAGDPAFERVAGALGAEADHAVPLADGLFPILDAADERRIVQRLPAFVDDDDRGRAVQPLLDAVEQVHHRRRAHGRIVQDLGHVEADDAGVDVEAVVGVVEQPGVLAALAPGAQPRGQVAGAAAAARRGTVRQVAQAPVAGRLGVVGVDRVRDHRAVLGVHGRAVGGEQLAQPVGQELAVGRDCPRAAAD